MSTCDYTVEIYTTHSFSRCVAYLDAGVHELFLTISGGGFFTENLLLAMRFAGMEIVEGSVTPGSHVEFPCLKQHDTSHGDQDEWRTLSLELQV